MTEGIDLIFEIESFEQKCVIIKLLLQSHGLKQHMVTIGIDKPLSNSVIYEHRCQEIEINFTHLLVNGMINRSIKLLLKRKWSPLLRDLMTTVQCHLELP